MNRLWQWVFIAGAGLLGACSEPPEQTGFAGLAETVEEGAGAFLQPGPGDRIVLPRDWGPHPQYRIEWWYLTANLETAAGEPVGLQWTQFRQGLKPRPEGERPSPESWPLESVWMAHAAVSTDAGHHFVERFARGEIGHAGARAAPFEVWLDDWQLKAISPGEWRLVVSTRDFRYDLTLRPSGSIVRHGDQGFSAKSASGKGSLYFSDTDIAIEGVVEVEGRTLAVSGTGWLDREWSSQFLRSDQEGWDWFALRLDSGAQLMAFRLREEQGEFRAGTWISADGVVLPLESSDLTIDPGKIRQTEHGQVPERWKITVHPAGQTFTVTARPGSYWNNGLYPYWESPVTVTGSARGEGYMELTGYRSDTR